MHLDIFFNPDFTLKYFSNQKQRIILQDISLKRTLGHCTVEKQSNEMEKYAVELHEGSIQAVRIDNSTKSGLKMEQLNIFPQSKVDERAFSSKYAYTTTKVGNKQTA